MINRNVMLIGLGPHAKRIYMRYLVEKRVYPKCIVDLEEKGADILKYLHQINVETEIILINDEERNNTELSSHTKQVLNNAINIYHITHAIISTEPKAHFAYLKFLASYNIEIIVDKPLTAPVDVMYDQEQAKKILGEYRELLNIKKHSRYNNKITMMCQRRYHIGYNYILQQVEKILEEYGLPISYVDLFHSDGMWNFPNEFLLRENHPYKYGYGKLFHSGFHFIDLVATILSLNERLNINWTHKKIFAMDFRPQDLHFSFDNQKYKQFFPEKDYTQAMKLLHGYHMGELDVYSMIQYMVDKHVLTTVTMNLMQNGFSRRSWSELPDDTYKGNGRVRHERLNICVGSLFNIQAHSYQSYELRDQLYYDDSVGGMDHFDIYIFRNTGLIGGQAFEMHTMKELQHEDISLNYGHNEKARFLMLDQFLSEQSELPDLNEYYQSIKLLYEICDVLIRSHGESILE